MKNLPELQEKAVSLREYLNRDNIKGALESALPKWLSIDRLLRIVFTSTMKNPKLLDCTLESLLQSIMQCAQLGLEPILGRAYLIPYNNKKQIGGKWTKVLECQFQPGYQGLVDLARRSGKVSDVFAMVVYENDDFTLEYGTNRKLEHKPYLGEDPGSPIGAYTVFELTDGTKTFEFMPLHKIYKRRDKSQAYQYAIANPKNDKAQECPWIQWPEEQMQKTVVKHHSKLQPASIEFMQAIELDNVADIGRSQVGMFSTDPNYAAISGPATDPEPLDTSEFERLVSELIEHPSTEEGKALDRFLELTAKAQGMSVDQLKVEAAQDFKNFWAAFENWLKKEDVPEDESNKDEDLNCKHPGCKFIAESLRGLKKHTTQQHSKKEESKEDDKLSVSDKSEGLERISIIEKIREEWNPDHIARAKAALRIPKLALTALSLDLLLIVQEKCETLK